MDQSVKVSVIMPAYKAEKYIAQSIESVLCQTYKNIEFVIVNDGSPDSTPDIIRRYEARYPETILFVDKAINEGTAITLNTAMQYATSDYMCWLSADDLYVETMVESQLSFLLDNPGFDACFSLSATIDENNKVLSAEPNKGEYIDKLCRGENIDLYKRLLLAGNSFHGCSLMGRRDNFLKAGGFDPKYRYAHDYAFWLRFAADANIGFVNAHNVLGRTYPTQISRQGHNEADAIKVWRDFVLDKDVFIRLMRRAGIDDYRGCVKAGYVNRIFNYQNYNDSLALLIKYFNEYLNE